MKQLLYTFCVALLLTSCSREPAAPAEGGTASEPATPPKTAVAPTTTPDAAPSKSAAQSTQEAVQKAAEGAQQAVAKVEESAHQAQAKAEEATAKAQVLLDQAKGYLGDKRVQDAKGILDQLAGMSLSADQQQLLAGLKQEFQKAWDEVEQGLGQLQTLVADQKYSEASSLVTQLASFQLSPDQQNLFDNLKAELQKALGGDAAEQGGKALQGLLK